MIQQKTNTRAILFIPTSKNWSEFSPKSSEENTDDTLAYDLGDKGEFDEMVLSNLQADQLLFSLLMNLDDREKIILLYQLIKEAGYSLTQEEFAKTLRFSRLYYTSLTKDLRKKCVKIIQGVSK